MKLPWRHAMTTLGWVGLPGVSANMLSLCVPFYSRKARKPERPEKQGAKFDSARSSKGEIGNGQRQGAVTLISIPPSLHLSIPPSLYLSIPPSHHSWTPLSFHPSVPLYLPSSFHPSLHPPILSLIHPPTHASLHPSSHPPICPTGKDWFHNSPFGFRALGRGITDHTAW